MILYCEQCQIKYKTHDSYKTIYCKTCDEQLKYSCKKCSKLYKSKQGCLQHLRQQQCALNEKNNKIKYNIEKCKTCNVIFKANELKKHELNCKKSKKEVYECSICSLRFPEKFYLLLHNRRNHEYIEPSEYYKCKICSKSFKIIYDFMAHKKSGCCYIQQDNIQQTVLKLYSCHYCSY